MNPTSRDERNLRPASTPPDRRLPLSERRRRARTAARARVLARTTHGLTAAQRGRDPLARRVSRSGRALRAMAAVLGSLALHVGIVAGGFALSGLHIGRRAELRQEVAIEVREREPPPPPPPPPPEPEPQIVEQPVRPPPRAAPEPPPPPEPRAPPPRVVGLSLESTTEGGSGPSFAVGNTREGKTAERAVDPKLVPAEAPAVDTPPEPNKVASRIPMAGVVLTLPRRVRPCIPEYPATLKAQAIEADVPVLVSLDATGKVTAVRIIKAPPEAEFSAAARACAESEVYEPARKNGDPIPYSFSFTYRFRLTDE
jgi:protein TonB